MYPDNQPSDASGAAIVFGNLPPDVPGAGAAWTGNNTQAGTTAQVPNATDAPEPTNYFIDTATMRLYDATQAVGAHYTSRLTENASMENGASHQADNFEHIAHPDNIEYMPESNNFELPYSNNLNLPDSNILNLPYSDTFPYLADPNNLDLPHSNIPDPPHLDEFDQFALALLEEDLEELPKDADYAFPAQQQLDEQPQQLLLQPNVQQWQPQPNEEQQQPQQGRDALIKQLKDLTELLETRHSVSPAQLQERLAQLLGPQHSVSPAQLQESLTQLLGPQQSASPAPFQGGFTQLPEFQQSASPAQLQEDLPQLLEPQQSASPAQLQQSELPAMAQLTQQSALPAMAQPTEQQQQQSRANPSPQRQPDLHATLEKISIITDNIKEVYARTSDCVGCVNMRVALGSSRQQELASFRVNRQMHQWVNDWVTAAARNPNAPILRDTPPILKDTPPPPGFNGNWNLSELLNGYNRSFTSLYLRAMSVSRDLKSVLQGLPHEWIFGKGPDAVPEELRQAVVECHTIALNTFNALLAFMEHDNNLLPYRFTDNNGHFDILSTINQTQGQGAQTADEIRYLTEKCHESILAHSRYVHSLMRDLCPYPVLPDLQQVQAITDDQLQMLLQQQQEAKQAYPMLNVCPFTAGPNTDNDQICQLEFCVFYRLNLILQRLPRIAV